MKHTVHQRKRAYTMQIDWTSSSAPALYCVPSRPSNWTFSSAPALYWCSFQAQQLDIFISTSIVLMSLPGPATGHFHQHQHCIDVPSRPSNWTFSPAPALYWCSFQAQQLDIFISTSIVLMSLPGPATGHFHQHQHCIDVPSRPSNWTFSPAPALYWCSFQAQQLDIFISTSIVLMSLPGPATGHFHQHQHCIDVPSRPSNCVNLQRIEDLPAAKAEQFGRYFVDTIVAFCQQHSLSLDQFPKPILYQVRLDLDFGCWDLFSCGFNRSTIQKWSIIFIIIFLFPFSHHPFCVWGGQVGREREKCYVNVFNSYRNKTCMIVPVCTNFGDCDLISMSQCCQ